MRKLQQLLTLLFFAVLGACSSDEPNPDNPRGQLSTNNSSVTINSDGTTSTGAVFSPIDETLFFLDYVMYKIADSHLEIISHDPVKIPEHVKPYASVTYRGVTYQTRAITDGAFYDCARMKSCEIPVTVSKIELAFIGCPCLTTVYFPESLETIGFGAFDECTGLASVDFPKGLRTIDVFAFNGCTGLTSLNFPKELETIRYGAFKGCINLRSVIFPEGLKAIEGRDDYNGVTSGAFERCTSLTTIKFPESLNTIGLGAFRDCTGLTSVSFPNGLASIGDYAFDGCTSLASVTLPVGLTSIGDNAFDGCTSLTSVNFPEGLESIGHYAFNGCTGLTSVTCFATNPPSISWFSFSDEIYNNATLYVPSAAVDEYKNAYGWRDFKNIQGI